MNMNKKLAKYYNSTTRSYWFNYQLKHDPGFRKEAYELDEQIAIPHADGTKYYPTGVEDFDYLEDPDKDKKMNLIDNFCTRWNIAWDGWLLMYLIRGSENFIPPMGHWNMALGFDENTHMFTVQIPLNIQREEFDILWALMKTERIRQGIDISSKPPKYTYNERDSELAYNMWKMRRDGLSWTKVAKYLNDSGKKNQLYDIKTAQQFLKTNGYYI